MCFGQNSGVSGIKIEVEGVDTLLWDGYPRHLAVDSNHSAHWHRGHKGYEKSEDCCHGCGTKGDTGVFGTLMVLLNVARVGGTGVRT